MDSTNKEWFNDMAHKAWEDLTKVAEIAEQDNYANTEECFYRILEVLKKGGWV